MFDNPKHTGGTRGRTTVSSCEACSRAAARLSELELEYERLRVNLVEEEMSPSRPGPLSRLTSSLQEKDVLEAGGKKVAEENLQDKALREEAEQLIEDGLRLRITIDTLVRGSLFEAKELVR